MKPTSLLVSLSAAVAIASPLLGIQSPASAQSRRTFSIRNQSQQPITAIYLSQSSRDSWGYNDLDSTLFDGNSVNYNLSGACDYDLKVVFANDRVVSQLRIDTCLNNSYAVRIPSQALTVRPVTSAGNYWVYEKPANVSESQMQGAGARFYPGYQACSLHYSLCVGYSGVWLSQQSSLAIQPEQSRPAQTPPAQTARPAPTQAEPVSNVPASDTELYLAYYRDCMDRAMFRTLRTSTRAIAQNGYDMGYRFGRKPGDLTDEQMEAAGLRWEWGFQSWIGPQSEVSIPVMASGEASQQCREEVDGVRL